MIPKIIHSYEIPANIKQYYSDKESEKLYLNNPNNYSSIDTTNLKNSKIISIRTFQNYVGTSSWKLIINFINYEQNYNSKG